MTQKNPNKNSESDKIEVDDRIDWLSYQMFGFISDYIVDNTSYSDYTDMAISKPSRYYVCRIIFDSIVTLLFLMIFFNVAYTLISAGSSVLGFISSTVEISSIFGLFVEFIRYSIDTILFVMESSLEFITRDLETEAIIADVIDYIGDRPILQPIVATLYGFYTTVQQLVIELTPSVEFTEVTLIPESFKDRIDQLINVEITPLLIRFVLTIILAPLIAGIYFVYRSYYPIYLSNEIKRAIDDRLPQASLFMYALTKGGLGLGRAMTELGESTETYGEISYIFRDITKRAEYSKGDLRQSILEESKRTNHDGLEEFLYGLVSVMDTGSDATSYLQLQTEGFLEQKRKTQESYFSFLDILSEIFIIIFVVAPVFVLVIQLVSALTGGVNRLLTQMVPYVLIPAGGFIISIVLYVIGTSGNNAKYIPLPKTLYEARYESKTGNKITRSTTLDDILTNIQRTVIENPYYSIFATLPLTLMYYSIMIQIGVIPLSLEGITEEMLQVTVYGYFIPLCLVLAPWSYVYEVRKKKNLRINRQLPLLLENIKEANDRGLTLEESFEAVATTDSTELYSRLTKAVNKSKITSNLNRSLIEFSNDLKVPRLSEAVSLLTKANGVSGNISKTVGTIANDFNELYEINRERRQRAKEYVTVVFVSILICTLLIIALDVVFFTYISEQGAYEQDGVDINVLGDIPVDFFRRVFLHTLMTISFFSGIVAGIMENNDAQNGFKYIIIFSTIGIVSYALMYAIFV